MHSNFLRGVYPIEKQSVNGEKRYYANNFSIHNQKVKKNRGFDGQRVADSAAPERRGLLSRRSCPGHQPHLARQCRSFLPVL